MTRSLTPPDLLGHQVLVSRLESYGTLRPMDDNSHSAEAALRRVNVCVCHLISRWI
jgi:hypothetical protein